MDDQGLRSEEASMTSTAAERLDVDVAIRLAPGMAAAYANLGLISLHESRFDKARRLLSRATKLEPDNAIYWEYLAELHGRLEQFPAAIRCWQRVLAQTPDDRA